MDSDADSVEFMLAVWAAAWGLGAVRPKDADLARLQLALVDGWMTASSEDTRYFCAWALTETELTGSWRISAGRKKEILDFAVNEERSDMWSGVAAAPFFVQVFVAPKETHAAIAQRFVSSVDGRVRWADQETVVRVLTGLGRSSREIEDLLKARPDQAD